MFSYIKCVNGDDGLFTCRVSSAVLSFTSFDSAGCNSFLNLLPVSFRCISSPVSWFMHGSLQLCLHDTESNPTWLLNDECRPPGSLRSSLTSTLTFFSPFFRFVRPRRVFVLFFSVLHFCTFPFPPLLFTSWVPSG